jgi:hypothetical protein
MNKFFAVAIAALVIFGSCGKEEEPAAVAVTGVTISPSGTQSLVVDGVLELTATVQPANAANKTVTWTTGNESLATVTNNGVVTAKAAGTTTITVTTEDGEHTAIVTVEISDKPAFSVEAMPISVAGTVSTASITVTGNTAWTASASADWITLDPAAGTGNQEITVNVAANTGDERSATVTVSATGFTPVEVTVTQEPAEPEDLPFYAASEQEWTFDGLPSLIWSDVIQMPDSDDETFEYDANSPQSRSAVYDGTHKAFYYNFTYVKQNAGALCPSPWRVPTIDDITALHDLNIHAILAAEWGAQGQIHSDGLKDVGIGFLWSSTDMGNGVAADYIWTSSWQNLDGYAQQAPGLTVRCVKDVE